MSVSSGSRNGPSRDREAISSRPARKYAASGHDCAEEDAEAGTYMREKALWLPVSENCIARSSRPSPDWCGAVLFEGQPGQSVKRRNAEGSAPEDESGRPSA